MRWPWILLAGLTLLVGVAVGRWSLTPVYERPPRIPDAALPEAISTPGVSARSSRPSNEVPMEAGIGPCTVTRVIDGDTVDVVCDGTRDRVRLLRIDTPERGEPGYREAGGALGRMVLGREAYLVFERPGVLERGSYGRALAYLYVEGRNINVEMVRQGWSGFWTKYGTGRFAEDFLAAEAEGAGLPIGGRRSDTPPLAEPASDEVARDCIPRSECCKVCSKGKACGASCIRRSYTCRKGRGCACNSSEGCR